MPYFRKKKIPMNHKPHYRDTKFTCKYLDHPKMVLLIRTSSISKFECSSGYKPGKYPPHITYAWSIQLFSPYRPIMSIPGWCC